MITSDMITPVNALKKEQYYGSFKGMHFSLFKSDDKLTAVTYPAPFCFKATDESLKTYKNFEFSDEGRLIAIKWLNEQYNERIDEWKKAASTPWI